MRVCPLFPSLLTQLRRWTSVALQQVVDPCWVASSSQHLTALLLDERDCLLTAASVQRSQPWQLSCWRRRT
jgi:hypothetical protein